MPRLVFGRLLSSCLCFGAASVIFTIAGCGGGDEAESSTAQTTPASSGSSAPAAPADGGGGGVAPSAPADNAGPAGATSNVPMAPDSGETPGAVGAGMAGAPGMSGPPGMSSAGAGISGAPGMSPESGGYGSAPGGYPGYPGGDGLAGGDGFGGGQTPGRPANVAEWSDEDLKSAVMERDRRVLEAIASRVKKSPGDQKVAELLVALIAASNEAPAQPAASAGAGGLAGPGASGYGSAPMMPGMSSGMQPPGMSSGMQPPGMQPGAGMSPLGAAPISGAPGMTPPKGGMSSPPGGGNAAPPQSSIQRKRRPLDSLNAMILESATAWQQPGVGAMAGRMQAGGGKIPGGAAPGAGAPSMDAGAGAAGGLPAPPSLPAMPGMSGPGPGAGMNMPGMSGMPGMNPAAPASGALTNEELVQGLADGLVQNKSQMAWQTLFAIVSGNMKTPLTAEENARVVVLSLCKNFKSDPTTIGQVLTALIDGSAPIPGESRNACYLALATVSGQALDGLTGLQAGAVAGLPGTSGPGMPGSGMMMPGMGAPGMGAPGMGAPGMGAPGMGAPGMGPGSSGFIESDGSGMPAPAGPAVTGTPTAIPADQLKAVSQVLWGDVCVNAIVKNLKAVTDPASGEALLAFAGSIPNRKIREAELEFLTKFHSAGADSLNSSGVLTSLARDPGMLVILKALPRGKAPKGDDKNQLDSWGSARQSLALSLRDQLRAASAGGGKMKSAGDAFPVKLHKGGEAEYSGVLTVSAAELGGAKDAEFKVYYARTSFSAQKPRDEDDMISHYEQKASGKGKLDQSKGLFWIDGVKTAPNGVRRSMDIFIGTAGGASGAGGGPPGGFGAPGIGGLGMGGPGMAPGGGGSGASVPVEIVVVEMTDPKGTTENATTVAEPVKR
ncbi:MAG: hypothetical protein JNM43_07560 [Planctomycetaceae bacterium]|nr:hypothetical protein [Planctomycetaceae bacterium]